MSEELLTTNIIIESQLTFASDDVCLSNIVDHITPCDQMLNDMVKHIERSIADHIDIAKKVKK